MSIVKNNRNIYRKLDLSGKRFSRLLVKNKEYSSSYKRNLWVCECDCGKIIKTRVGYLLEGRVKSCGCFSREKLPKYVSKHNKSKHYLYPTWHHMKDRCYNKNNNSYKDYGKRGISVCNRWLKGEDGKHPFICFLEDMGDRPDGYSLDRIDFNGNYCPENCRWADRITQSKNKRTSTETYNKLVIENKKLKKEIKILKQEIELLKK